eukprot:scaffold5562_cov156-Skeletonema_marinoi.AAC.5
METEDGGVELFRCGDVAELFNRATLMGDVGNKKSSPNLTKTFTYSPYRDGDWLYQGLKFYF